MSHSLSLRIQRLLTQNNVFAPNLLNLVKLEINATLSGTTLFRENNICTIMFVFCLLLLFFVVVVVVVVVDFYFSF